MGVYMAITADIFSEMQILCLFDVADAQKGIKIHSDAEPSAIAAAQRLFNKQLISQMDGGYLTPLGYEAMVKLQQSLHILRTTPML